MLAGWTTLVVVIGSIALPFAAIGAMESAARRLECIELSRIETTVILQCSEGEPIAEAPGHPHPVQGRFDYSRYNDARIDGSEVVNLREELYIDRVVTELPRNRLVQVQPIKPIEYRGSRYYFVVCYDSPQRGWVAENYLRQP